MRKSELSLSLLAFLLICQPVTAEVGQLLAVELPENAMQSASFQTMTTQSGNVGETIQFLSTADDISASKLMPALEAGQRPKVVLDTLKVTEEVLMQNGWKKCDGPVIKSESTPFGFQFFSKVARCFYSASDNAGLWITQFMSASVSDQSLFFTAIERLRRSMMRENGHKPVRQSRY